MKIDLSIISINYNTADLVLAMVDSFKKAFRGIEYEFIIIDNNSEKHSIEKLKSELAGSRNIKLIRNSQNLGFGANNAGLASSRGRYILFLNSDTLADDINFKDLLLWMDNNPNVGAMTCTLKNSDGSIQGTGGSFPTLFRVFLWMFFFDDIPGISRLFGSFHPHSSKSPFKNDKFYKSERRLDWITGAFFLARKEALGDGFDPDYFMYGEDVDLSKKIRNNRYDIVYSPRWSIIHLGGKSSNASYPIISEFNGLKIFYKKHYGNRLGFLRLIVKAGLLFRIAALTLIGKSGLARTYVEAYKKF